MILETQIDRTIAAILAREGGYVNDPTDHGGATNFGITQAAADEYSLGPVQNMSETTAKAWYRARFAEWKIDQIPDYATFDLVADCCVNHGEGMGVKWLQQAIGVTADGAIGPATLNAMARFPLPLSSHMGIVNMEWPAIFNKILAARIQFYGRIVAANHDQAKFISGWLNRATAYLISPPA